MGAAGSHRPGAEDHSGAEDFPDITVVADMAPANFAAANFLNRRGPQVSMSRWFSYTHDIGHRDQQLNRVLLQIMSGMQTTAQNEDANRLLREDRMTTEDVDDSGVTTPPDSE